MEKAMFFTKPSSSVQVSKFHKMAQKHDEINSPNPGTVGTGIFKSLETKIQFEILEPFCNGRNWISLSIRSNKCTHPHAHTRREAAHRRHGRSMAKRGRNESRTQSAKLPARQKSAAAVAAIWLLSYGGGITRATGIFVCETEGWDVTPSKAYTWSNAPPQGCTCQETGVPLADCKASYSVCSFLFLSFTTAVFRTGTHVRLLPTERVVTTCEPVD